MLEFEIYKARFSITILDLGGRVGKACNSLFRKGKRGKIMIKKEFEIYKARFSNPISDLGGRVGKACKSLFNRPIRNGNSKRKVKSNKSQ